MKQWTKPTKIWRSPAALVLLLSNTTTDLNALELSWIAKTATIAGTDDMHKDTLPGEVADMNGSYYVLWPETTATLVNDYYNPYRKDVDWTSIYSPFYNPYPGDADSSDD